MGRDCHFYLSSCMAPVGLITPAEHIHRMAFDKISNAWLVYEVGYNTTACLICTFLRQLQAKCEKYPPDHPPSRKLNKRVINLGSDHWSLEVNNEVPHHPPCLFSDTRLKSWAKI
jgi:hypothetical protein